VNGSEVLRSSPPMPMFGGRDTRPHAADPPADRICPLAR
jgi:hypothetical protein